MSIIQSDERWGLLHDICHFQIVLQRKDGHISHVYRQLTAVIVWVVKWEKPRHKLIQSFNVELEVDFSK